MSKTKLNKIQSLKDEILENDTCHDLRAYASQLVMGEGNLDADLVFIGEAPGKKEDELGRPFVGASGKFLDDMLSYAELDRSDVYITNIVKYRPPDNRDPKKQEKAEFWPYLLRQIDIIDPKVIITLGRHSGMAFLPDLVISRDHGNAQSIDILGRKRLVIPLYHPAAALYNGSMRQVLIDDFLGIAKYLDLPK